jgi:hypothetical protein
MWRRASVVQAQRHVHGVVGEQASDALAPDGHRCPVAERLMRAAAIVESNPGGDSGTRLAAIGIALDPT